MERETETERLLGERYLVLSNWGSGCAEKSVRKQNMLEYIVAHLYIVHGTSYFNEVRLKVKQTLSGVSRPKRLHFSLVTRWEDNCN